MALIEGGNAAAPAKVRGFLRRKQTPQNDAASGRSWVKAMPWLESAVHAVLHDREPVVGVEIAPGHIRLCQMEQEDDRWELKALATVNVGDGQSIHDIRGHEAQYAEALKELLRGHAITTEYAAVALPLASCIIRTITTANMADKDIEAAIAMGTFWQGLVQLSVKLKDYAIYHEVLGRDEAAGTMDILFVAARNADLALYTGILKQAGLKPMVADVQCFALQNAFRLNRDEIDGGAPTVLLKFGADENYILLTDRGKPYLYEVYIPDNERENIGEQLNNPEFAQRFATQVKQILVKHAAKNPGAAEVKKLRMVSLIATPAFVEAVRAGLPDYEVIEWNPFRHVAIPEALVPKVQAEGNPAAWTVPMGLAVRSLTIVDWFHHKDNTDHVNLLPQTEDFIKAQRVGLFSKLGLSVYTAAALIVAVVMAGAVMQQAHSVNTELKKLQSIEKEHKEKSAEVNNLRGRVKKLDLLDKFIAEQPSNQKVLLEVYQETATVIPEGVWLSKMQFSPPSSVEMTGRALDDAGILSFIKGLEKNRHLSRVALRAMQAEDSEAAKPVKTYTLVGTVGVLQTLADIQAKKAEENDPKKKKDKKKKEKSTKDKKK